MNHRPRILLVDDEASIVETLAEYLDLAGFRAETANSGAALDRLLEAEPADVLMLDLQMPGESGRDILLRWREKFAGPIVILTGVRDVVDRVILLELGADDFISKPVEPRELVARLNGLLKRYAAIDRPLLRLERVTVDFRAAVARFDDGRSERLSPGELALLRLLADNAGKVLAREELLESAAASDDEAFDRAIDSRISRLRKKLETEAIQTSRGLGYVLTPPQSQRAQA